MGNIFSNNNNYKIVPVNDTSQVNKENNINKKKIKKKNLIFLANYKQELNNIL